MLIGVGDAVATYSIFKTLGMGNKLTKSILQRKVLSTNGNVKCYYKQQYLLVIRMPP